MSEETNKPNESRKLTDEELGEVAGGYGWWDVDMEATELSHYNSAHDPKYTTFESFVAGYWGEDYMTARQEWINNNKPEYKRFVVTDSGMIRSETRRPAPVRPRLK